VLVEISTETALQRSLPDEVFGRAYGIALPAAIAGIAVGALVAPVLVAALGFVGALTTCGALPLGYGLLILVTKARGAALAASTSRVGPAARDVLARAEA